MTEKKRTIFCDIDGTIFKYRKFETLKTAKAEMTPGALDKLKRWKRDGCMIVFTTARPEEYRNHTVKELLLNGVPWDKLVMGIERGARYLINDMDPAKPRHARAVAYSIKRDEGLKKIVVGDTEEIIG
jgi:hydroxymethylpyrimidine pyrophosphatase-like HAD family hydrolase